MSWTPVVLEKRLYTATTTATAERDGRVKKATTENLDVAVVPPRAIQGGGGAPGTNPEQLYAGGYAACFGSALGHVARLQKITLDGPVSITASTSPLGPVGEGLRARGWSSSPLSRSCRAIRREALLRAAHEVCPYSNATRGNIGDIDVRARLSAMVPSCRGSPMKARDRTMLLDHQLCFALYRASRAVIRAYAHAASSRWG